MGSPDSGAWRTRVQQTAPFYVEKGHGKPDVRAFNWQSYSRYWYRVGLVPPKDSNDTTDTGTGTMPTANALFFALQNIRVGGSNAVYLHFRASFTDYYDTNGGYEWRIARISMKLLTDVLTEGPVRDVRFGSGGWFDDMMQRITNMPINQVLTVRIKEVQ